MGIRYNLIFPKNKQTEFISNAINLIGSERKLAKITNIPKSCISDYHREKVNISEKRALKIVSVARNLASYLSFVNKIPADWGRVKGGKNCVLIKIQKGLLEENLKKMHKASSQKMKLWHRELKRNNRKFYYNMQYERFKKIGGYKLKTLRGEKVRNFLEKDVADVLFKNNINYQYEPYLEIKNHVFFPDFILTEEKIIVEVTYWRGFQNANKLKRKIKLYEQLGYKAVCVIPTDIQKFYKCITKFIVSTPHELVESARVAQTATC
jgi:hypothetical protein